MGSTPLVLRLGGLPCAAMEAFSTRLGEGVEALSQAEAVLSRARDRLVERLYEAIPGTSPEARGLLLAVKRDCHNGRPLAPRRGSPAWRFVEEAAGEIATEVLDLERQVESATRALALAYEQEVERQHRHLAGLLDEPLFRCGLAVASTVVAREARRLLEKPPEEYGRRERRLVLTLLRYASRAAFKLSPFATFTPVGLALIEDGDGALQLAGGPWSRRSLVRLRRHLLDRCADLLLGYAPWRRRLAVALNDSAIPLSDGRWLYRRPSHYRLDDATGRLRYHEEALVRVRLGSPLIERLRSLLAAGSLTHAELVARLAREQGEESTDEITRRIDRLVDIGFLHLLPPWSSGESRLEQAMWRELRRLDGDPALGAFLAQLERLVRLEEGLLQAPDPVAVFQELEGRVDGLLRGAALAAGLAAGVDVTTRPAGHDVYQDVWCAPAAGERLPLARVGRSPLEEACRSGESLLRYARLYDHRLEFLCSLGAFLRARHRAEIPLLEAFREAQPLWQEFVTFEVRSRDRVSGWRSTWNPMGLPILDDLAQWRAVADRALQSCLVDEPQGRRLVLPALDALLRSMPAPFTDAPAGACLFLQPASRDGSLWMLNRLKEGTGRFASRYTPLMPPLLRNRYTGHLRRRGTLEAGGEVAELLDVDCIQGDTLNVHAPQTPKVLALQPTATGLPAHRRRSLKDLRVVVAEDGWPRLRDHDGRRYLPVHLGVGHQDYVATLVKFLCAFGPSEPSAVFPAPRLREEDGITIQDRTTAGNLVLHRRAWHVPAAQVRSCLERSPEPAAFAALERWRRARGIPERVFAVERVSHPLLGTHSRPQFLDLTSPLFVGLLRAVLDAADATLQLTEALPSPDHFPRDGEGRAWAVELLLDSLSLRAPAAFEDRPVAPSASLSHGGAAPVAHAGGTGGAPG